MIKKACFILLFLSVSTLAFAQFKISGKVLNGAENQPLESATVFLNNTKYGTKTAKDGSFTIYNLQPGHYELIISMIGFKASKVAISVQSDIKLPAILINERAIPLNEVKITTARKLDSKYIDLFKREILGDTKFGRQCRIINPKVIQLDFDDNENKLTAYTSDFMIIDNKALGYRLKYLVDNFERNEKTELISYVGYVLFEEMQGNDRQRREWKENRLAAYTGSLQHFIRSVLGNNINNEEETGFLVAIDTRSLNKHRQVDSVIKEKIHLYSGKYNREDLDSLLFWTNMLKQSRYIEVLDTMKLRAKNLIQATDQKGLFALKINSDSNYIKKWGLITVPGVKGRISYTCDTCSFKNSLYITYIKSIPKKLGKSTIGRNYSIQESFTPTPDMDKAASLISVVNGYVFFDWNGAIINPMNLKIERYWANLRLGDLLPIDYLPDIDTQPM